MKKKSFITRCLQNHINLYLSLQIQRDSLFRCWMRKYRPGSSRISVYLRLEIIATVNQTAIIRPDVVLEGMRTRIFRKSARRGNDTAARIHCASSSLALNNERTEHRTRTPPF